MTKWVTQDLENLLRQINEVPFTDDRDSKQLTIIMNGFAQLNNSVMDRAAAKTRDAIKNIQSDIALEKDLTGLESSDQTAEELTRLRPIR